jgi:hypothetical protein
MTRKRSAKSLPEYAVSDEAAAYIADALIELALKFEASHFAQIRHHKSIAPERDADAPWQLDLFSRHHPFECRAILWFDPRREHSSVPTAKPRSRRAQGLSRLAATFAATRRAWP